MKCKFYRPEFDNLDFSRMSEPTNKKVMTRKEALYDLDLFMYLCETSCASFNRYFKAHKLLLIKRYKKVKKNLLSLSKIKICDFYDLLLDIGKGIKDLHSVIRYYHKQIYKVDNFLNPLIIWVSKDYFYAKGANVYVMDTDESIHIKSEVPKNTTRIIENKFYMIPVLSVGQIKFHLGVFRRNGYLDDSEKDVVEVCSKKIFLYKIKNDFDKVSDYQKKFNTRNMSYWKMPHYGMDKDEYFFTVEKMINESKQSRMKQNILIDNRRNSGCPPYDIVRILYSLFNVELPNEEIKNNIEGEDILEGSVIISNPIAKCFLFYNSRGDTLSFSNDAYKQFWEKKQNELCNGIYKWHYHDGKENPFWYYTNEIVKKSKFSGTIIVVMGWGTISGGELIYNLLVNQLGYKNVLIIGCISRGCVSYGNVHSFQLTNSDINLWLSSSMDYDLKDKVFLENIVECRGYIPDLWCTTEEEFYEILCFLEKGGNIRELSMVALK